jgi:flagellar hook-basal body complex protein FliE
MIAPIVPITAIASAAPAAAAPAAASATAGAGSFSNVLGSAIDALGSTTANADTLAVQGATGQANVADVTVAAQEAQLSVQLATTTRDDAVTAFNSIMSMSAG